MSGISATGPQYTPIDPTKLSPTVRRVFDFAVQNDGKISEAELKLLEKTLKKQTAQDTINGTLNDEDVRLMGALYNDFAKGIETRLLIQGTAQPAYKFLDIDIDPPELRKK